MIGSHDDDLREAPRGWLMVPPPEARPIAPPTAGRLLAAAGSAPPPASDGEASPETVLPLAANADLVPDEGPARRLRIPRPGRRAAILAAILGGLLFLGLAGAAYATYDYSNRYDGKILPGAKIAGVDVGGMTESDAVAAVRDAIRPQLDREIEITWSRKSWKVTPRELGAYGNARAAVRAALDASRGTSFVDKMRMRVLGSDLEFDSDVAIRYPAKGVNGFIEGLASGLDRDPVEPSLDYSTGWVEVVQGRVGRSVNVDASKAELMEALRGSEDSSHLYVATRRPESSDDAFDQVLLLRIGENKLYLYQDGKITHEWLVATGQPEYPTPTGEYEITLKRYMPTWVNPDPTGWGASMPASIPPGPGNPLGLRALNWDAPAIRFHGTSAIYSLGYNASHGCVRMSNEDVIELYDIVDVGTPIISTVVAPLKPMYASAPDPIVVEEDAGEDQPRSDAGDAKDRGKGSEGSNG